ncbi:MAG TPA: glycosyltransferase family 2 protein [Stellaceae bacterium]|nr:glycosyltransferase family 2 protein [Stellaceae bacterium]
MNTDIRSDPLFPQPNAPLAGAHHDRHGVRLSVVVPCYNEAANLAELYRRLAAVCREVADDRHEIVMVDDGSRDGTWTVMRDLADRDPRMVAVKLSRNFGHEIALSAGLGMARGERILIIDADLQDPPELLGPMMAKMDAGADVVYGQRLSRAGEPQFKKITAALFYRVLDRLVDFQVPRDTGDFRLMSRRALDVLNAMPEQHRFVRGMVSWIGLRQEALPYERAPRFAGATNYPVTKLIRLALDAVTGFSTQPLRLASYLGIAVAASGALLLMYALIGWLSGVAVEGWTSLMVVLVTLTSAQLLVLGIMGEYIGRIYLEAKRRPLFVIDEIVSVGPKRPEA